MKKISVSHTRRWLALLLVLVILTTIATYLLTYVEISRTLNKTLTITGSGAVELSEREVQTQLDGLKIRLLLILSGGVLTICLLGYLWVRVTARRLSQPLQTISNALSKIACGKLNETVNINTHDEFAQIGTGINELAANLQELLLHIWKQSGQCLEELQELEVNTTKEAPYIMTPSRLNHLKQLHKAVGDLREIAKAYVFYDVQLEGEKTMALAKPGHSNPPEKDRTAGSEL